MERIVIEEDINIRLDAYLSKNTDYSRSKISKMITNGDIKVNDLKVKNSYLLKKGDIVEIGDIEVENMNVEAENIPQKYKNSISNNSK